MNEEIASKRVLLVRHGETAWSASGKHTSRTNLPLSDEGVEQAKRLRTVLAGKKFSTVRTVLCSPMKRALQTCSIAGYEDRAQVCQALVEWNYGDYEGLTTAVIRQSNPSWSLWHDGAPGGESPDEVAKRADEVLEYIHEAPQDILVFSHAHFLRALASRWISMGIDFGERLSLSTASVSTLGFEHDLPVIVSWNALYV